MGPDSWTPCTHYIVLKAIKIGLSTHTWGACEKEWLLWLEWEVCVRETHHFVLLAWTLKCFHKWNRNIQGLISSNSPPAAAPPRFLEKRVGETLQEWGRYSEQWGKKHWGLHIRRRHLLKSSCSSAPWGGREIKAAIFRVVFFKKNGLIYFKTFNQLKRFQLTVVWKYYF